MSFGRRDLHFRALVSVPLWDMGLFTSGEALGTYPVGVLKGAFRIRARLRAGPDVTITVADTGDRADTARDRAHGGSGIGLTIALLQQFVDKFRASPAFTPNTAASAPAASAPPSRRDTYQPVGLTTGVSADGADGAGRKTSRCWSNRAQDASHRPFGMISRTEAPGTASPTTPSNGLDQRTRGAR